MLNRFTSDSAKSKIDEFSKFTNWLELKNNNSPMNGHTLGFLSIESKVRKLCITQGFTLGVKGLK